MTDPSGMHGAFSSLIVMIYVMMTIQMLVNIYSFKHANQILEEISEKQIGNIKQLQSIGQDQEENHKEINQKCEENPLTNQFIQKQENQLINYYEQVSE
ncbi:transmembrane protein, putative (macronuclear) [Tetrahymena thermophila SB210]|uniref:Transmembrane protein, putative n=1 Tax=Tetrahymena thermophila (strain SB210) TaxID=312017 RepID=Q23CL8_TETTS|nr:transmembrane protein, putative [Tetrahymena thermophila SB210]EAR94262.1 transmembrane protein, putative [Tetrahymena thermophila SB210]|eukprot:XP_001014507.1 transmembrane protein, putative [Tetrahymena thermophila SB210]